MKRIIELILSDWQHIKTPKIEFDPPLDDSDYGVIACFIVMILFIVMCANAAATLS